MSDSGNRYPIISIAVVALAVRLTWVLLQPSDTASITRLPDQLEYLSLANNLIEHDSLEFTDSRFNQQPVFAYRMPGYPLFVAACRCSVKAVRITQAVVDTLSVLAVYLLARRLTGNALASLLAALAIAFNPFMVYFTGLILSETIFAALLVWGMYFCAENRLLPAAVFFAAAVLVRPSAIPVAVIVAGTAPLVNRGSLASYSLNAVAQKMGIWTATMSTILICTLAPWAVRNLSVLDHAVWTTTNGGITFYDGFNPTATGASDQRFVEAMPQLWSMNELQRDSYLNHQARTWAIEHPGNVLRLTAAKIARTWSPVPLSAEFGQPIFRWISAGYSIPFDLLILGGLIFSRMTRLTKLWLLLPAICFTVIHGLSVGSIRYRVPVEPMLAVLAGAGGAILFRRSGDNKVDLAES